MSMGRIIFLLCEEAKTVILLWAYSHKQFSKRPPHADLRRAILDILDLLE